MYSPRVWGWTAAPSRCSPEHTVFPTRVGVDRFAGVLAKHGLSIPHACGGGPCTRLALRSDVVYSPRVWGWTDDPWSRLAEATVFPTRVGVDRSATEGGTYYDCIPHACGGGPHAEQYIGPEPTYSPRVWGWTELACCSGMRG